MILWIFVNKPPVRHMQEVLLGKYLGVILPGHTVCECSTLQDNAIFFQERFYQLTLPQQFIRFWWSISSPTPNGVRFKFMLNEWNIGFYWINNLQLSHYSSRLLDLYVFLLLNVYSSLSPIFDWVAVFFSLICRSSFILDINPW